MRGRAALTASVVLVAGVAVALAGCSGNAKPKPTAGPADQQAAAHRCPATSPAGDPPVAGRDFNYGTRSLAVLLWPNGTLVAGRLPDGSAYAEIGPDGAVTAKQRAAGKSAVASRAPG